jgi:threonine/homoserine/homoserine lactone efflux protein
MQSSLLLSLMAFAVASSITPGPNNLMLLASGANYGFRRSIPHMLGIGIGFIVMMVVIGLGVGQMLQASPRIYTGLRVISVLYMGWLAWRIATGGPVDSSPGNPHAKPMTFLQAVLFQWVNPKAIAMALAATATYTDPSRYAESLLVVALVFGSINLPCVSVWAGFGVALRNWLKDPARLRLFNVGMAVLLVVSFLPLVKDLLQEISF